METDPHLSCARSDIMSIQFEHNWRAGFRVAVVEKLELSSSDNVDKSDGSDVEIAALSSHLSGDDGGNSR